MKHRKVVGEILYMPTKHVKGSGVWSGFVEAGQTVECPICGDPYVAYSHYVGDQSACPKCRAEAL